MDPYVPHLSQPVVIDTVAIRGSRLLRLAITLLLVLMVAVLLLAVEGDVFAHDFTEDHHGQVIIYREVPRRSAIRESYPERPVAVQTGSLFDHSEPLPDDVLFEITTMDAAQIHSNKTSQESSRPPHTHSSYSGNVIDNQIMSRTSKVNIHGNLMDSVGSTVTSINQTIRSVANPFANTTYLSVTGAH